MTKNQCIATLIMCAALMTPISLQRADNIVEDKVISKTVTLKP